jgi:hypothetical protein
MILAVLQQGTLLINSLLTYRIDRDEEVIK